MKQLLYVEQFTQGNELSGEGEDRWERIREEWFDVQPLTAREYVQAQQVQSNISHKIRCPFFVGAHSGLRLVTVGDDDKATRVFNIESVVNVGENNRELEWMATEV